MSPPGRSAHSRDLDLGATGFLTESVHSTALMLLLPSTLTVPELLRDLLRKVPGEANSKRRARSMARRSPLARALADEQMDFTEALAEKAITAAKVAARRAASPANRTAISAVAFAQKDPVAAFLKVIPIGDLARSALPTAIKDLTDPEQGMYFLSYLSYRQAVESSEHLQVPYKTIYVAAMNAVESLLAMLLQRAFMAGVTGEALEFQAAQEAAADALRPGGPAKWRDVFTRVIGSRQALTAIDWTAVNHAWSHRNLFVHRGGIADARFTKAVAGGIAHGDMVTLQRADVERVIELALTTRLAMLLCVWEAIVGRAGTGFEGYLEELAYQYLGDGRPAVSRAVCDIALALGTGQVARARIQVARWIALRSQGILSDYRTEVARWRTTGLPQEFRLAKLVLLDRESEALTLLDVLIQSGAVDRSAFDTWELFRPIRERRGGADGRP